MPASFPIQNQPQQLPVSSTPATVTAPMINSGPRMMVIPGQPQEQPPVRVPMSQQQRFKAPQQFAQQQQSDVPPPIPQVPSTKPVVTGPHRVPVPQPQVQEPQDPTADPIIEDEIPDFETDDIVFKRLQLKIANQKRQVLGNPYPLQLPSGQNCDYCSAKLPKRGSKKWKEHLAACSARGKKSETPTQQKQPLHPGQPGHPQFMQQRTEGVLGAPGSPRPGPSRPPGGIYQTKSVHQPKVCQPKVGGGAEALPTELDDLDLEDLGAENSQSCKQSIKQHKV